MLPLSSGSFFLCLFITCIVMPGNEASTLVLAQSFFKIGPIKPFNISFTRSGTYYG